jgi:hypothetical protein
MVQFSAQQRRVIDTPGVRLIGVDAKGRPVVEVKSQWGSNMLRWALRKDGDPADIVPPISIAG